MAQVGTVIRGKASVFGGSNDDQSVKFAPGRAIDLLGIAVYDNSTGGGYWNLRAPNGRALTVRQVDLGPAPWTGRKFDLTPKAASAFGYSYNNFPTDQGIWVGQYVGTQVASGPYSSPGNYKSGVWLVAKGDRGAIVDIRHLPAVGQGFKYYWLGNSQNQAQSRLADAIVKLRVRHDDNPYDAIHDAFTRGKHNLAQSNGIKDILGGVLFGIAGAGAIRVAAGAAAGEAEGAAAGGAAGSEAGALGGAASVLSFLKNWRALLALSTILGALLDPKFLLRIGMILAGGIMLIIGLKAMLTNVGRQAA